MVPKSIISTIVKQLYGLEVDIRKLSGEIDDNYQLISSDAKYILKVVHQQTPKERLELQIRILEHLRSHVGHSLLFPRIVPTIDQQPYFPIDLNNAKNPRYAWLLEWIPGRLWNEIKPKNRRLRAGLGEKCGLLTNALESITAGNAAKVFIKWDPAQTSWVEKHLSELNTTRRRKVAQHFYDLFERDVLPFADQLPHSLNHNDLNDYNILISDKSSAPEVTGFIDFGDAVFTYTVNELAIACSYGAMGLEDPLGGIMDIVRHYHAVAPLSELEIKVLFPLIGARLLISVVCSAINQKEHPDNPYLLISEQPAWDLLQKLYTIHPHLAHYKLRQACNFEPCPLKRSFEKWITKYRPVFSPIVNFPKGTNIKPLDLSVGSLELGNTQNFKDVVSFSKTINQLLDKEGATVGMGGYAETRPIYTTDSYTVMGNEGPKWRTVHLGLDIWVEAGTPVFAPYSGRIHAVKDNAGERNFGPTIILEHHTDQNQAFYTLYGHMSRPSLNTLSPGIHVIAGQQIGTIGAWPENGHWPPHLHFQIILDVLGLGGNYPGVAYPEDKDTWLSICPDPSTLFPFPALKRHKSLSQSELLQRRKKVLGPNLSISYEKHLHIVRGYKQYLYDSDGQRYLDMVNNVAHVGHEHPQVVADAQAQIAVLNTNSRYLHEQLVRYAEELTATFPPELCVCYFVNSGSEANELALRMAKTLTKASDIIALEAGYHGNTSSCIDVSAYKFDRRGGKGKPDHTHIAPIPDLFRGLYRNDDPAAGKKYADHISSIIEQLSRQGRKPAAFIAESILSCGGQIVLPPGFLRAAYHHIRRAGGICIADEVQVGFGRVGKYFWGYELQGVVPDIVTLGKPIGNGHPLGAVITTQAVASAFANGMEFFSTFGGNPVSCAIGRSVLRVVQAEQLQKNAREMGQYLLQRLMDLQQRHPVIGDVRGEGLFLGFELVRDRRSLEPAAGQATYLVNRMRERGILLSTDGPYENVIKIKPPMCITLQDIDFAVENLDRVLAEDYLSRLPAAG